MTKFPAFSRLFRLEFIFCLIALVPALAITASGQGLYTAYATGLKYPDAVALDSSNNLFIADPQAGLFGGSGAVATTLASTSLDWVTGIAVDGSGDVFLVDSGGGGVYEVASSDGSLSQLNLCTSSYCPGGYWVAGDGPYDANSQVALDSSGNVYVSDGGDLWKYSGGSWNVLSGTTYLWDEPGHSLSATQISAYGISLDSYDNIFLTDENNCIVQAVYEGNGGTIPNVSSPTSGNVYTIAGGSGCGYTSSGAATSAHLPNPQGVAVDSYGNVFISGSGYINSGSYAGGNVIQEVSVSTGDISTIAGNDEPTQNPIVPHSYYDAGPTSAGVYTPLGLAFDSSGNLYIAAQNTSSIMKIVF